VRHLKLTLNLFIFFNLKNINQKFQRPLIIFEYSFDMLLARDFSRMLHIYIHIYYIYSTNEKNLNVYLQKLSLFLEKNQQMT